jgi:hypothetical protein
VSALIGRPISADEGPRRSGILNAVRSRSRRTVRLTVAEPKLAVTTGGRT